MYAYSDKLMPGIGLLRTSQAYVALQINPVSAPVLVPAQFLDMNSRPSWNDTPLALELMSLAYSVILRFIPK